MAKRLCPLCKKNQFNEWFGMVTSDGLICSKCYDKFSSIMGYTCELKSFSIKEVDDIIHNPPTCKVYEGKHKACRNGNPLDTEITIEVCLKKAGEGATDYKIALSYMANPKLIKISNTVRPKQVLKIDGAGLSDGNGNTGNLYIFVIDVKYDDMTMKKIELEKEQEKETTGGFFGGVKSELLRKKQDAAVKKAYRIEEEKRKSHIQRIEHRRELTALERQTIDQIDMEIGKLRGENLNAARAGKDIPMFDSRVAALCEKKIEIESRCVWYEEKVIPPEVDPSVPIVIDEDAIRRSITSLL